jgi:hypothetical protein
MEPGLGCLSALSRSSESRTVHLRPRTNAVSDSLRDTCGSALQFSGAGLLEERSSPAHA